MRALTQQGRTFVNPWLEEAATTGAFAQFDFRPVPQSAIAADAGPTNILGVTPDEAGDGIGLAPGNPVIGVDAPSTIGTIGTIGDQDFYQVTLQAGHAY